MARRVSAFFLDEPDFVGRRGIQQGAGVSFFLGEGKSAGGWVGGRFPSTIVLVD